MNLVNELAPSNSRTTWVAPGCEPAVRGSMLDFEGDRFYRIDACDSLPPFLVNVVSDDDHWMFVTSNGGITAGRRTPDEALFPYCTQDKLIDGAGSTGSLSVIHIRRSGIQEPLTWEPWAPGLTASADRLRSVWKNRTGSCLVFEETRRDLGLTWRHRWTSSPRHGVVRRAEIENLGADPVELRLLDGLQNLLPSGLGQVFQNQYSILGDAYKRAEFMPAPGIGLFYLSSIPTDRAEPSESLRTTVAWSTGLSARHYLLSTAQLTAFRADRPVQGEVEVRGRRGAFLVETAFTLAPGERTTWWITAAVGLDATDLTRLAAWLQTAPDPAAEIEADCDAARRGLERRVGTVDGIQISADELRCWRHFSNAMFNAMRGGVFEHGGLLPREDFVGRLHHFSRAVHARHRPWLDALPSLIARDELEARARASGDPDLCRHVGEYLPLSFSRRHGDPSRPWNRFAIETRDRSGRPRLAYQGNWRDIFQNWEALLHAYPAFLEAAVFRFLNASTADGYNPYRISHEGFEWETIDPHEPWSNIGYWGDHQIVYLLKLLEASARFHPGRLAALLDATIFTFADVPYRIRGYERILADPRHTIDFDEEAARAAAARVASEGADGRLLHHRDGTIVRVNLAEKLLLPLLAKLANFVPEGGIWMNTQRPEWNDANNALVGYGVSVVTLGYLHRYVRFLQNLLARPDAGGTFALNAELAAWLDAQRDAFASAQPCLASGFSPEARKAMMAALGQSASRYRDRLYGEVRGAGTARVERDALLEFLGLVGSFLAHSLRNNRRPDGLYHSYNLLAWNGGGVRLERLDEMLEGQVSILSSEVLPPADAVHLLDALRASRLFRPDQQSYLLYPDRELPAFLEKNVIPGEVLARSRLLAAMLAAGDTRLVARDARGQHRFNASFRNAADLGRAIDAIDEPAWRDLARAERQVLEEIHESTFHHHRYTGRSGTFFAYEGLGSIYWHMVSKLVLAIQENHERAAAAGADEELTGRLAAHYCETLAGLGMHKTPAEYGAFPTDAYSHTPAHAGAQQPGMTGQVKEDLLVRWGELGVSVSQGRLSFAPRLLRRAEFCQEAAEFSFYNLEGGKSSLRLQPRSIAFTCCQVPVIYVLEDGCALTLHRADGSVVDHQEPVLTERESAEVFERMGAVTRIVVRPHPEDMLP